jgi:hypothetical protein
MTILDEDTIDFAGLERASNSLVLTIVDHLEWDQETDDVHLLFLQNKINAYLRYYEGGEVYESFSQGDYENVVIRVIAKHPFNDICMRFFTHSKPIVGGAGIDLQWEVSPFEEGGS